MSNKIGEANKFAKEKGLIKRDLNSNLMKLGSAYVGY